MRSGGSVIMVLWIMIVMIMASLQFSGIASYFVQVNSAARWDPYSNYLGNGR